uniref:glucan endo-1,3-beta-D-glucosidase n=1 Tax=Achlya hypogyna TaxID=1202772 RepID=A0A0A7CNK2_ACHHY|nr:secreted protein [Achlya hypogyna]
MLRVSYLLLALLAMASAMDFRLYGLNYNSRQGPDWDPKKCKTSTQIDADMAKIKLLADRVRIYSLVDCNQGPMVLASAKKAGLKTWLGMWVTNQATFDAEMAVLKQMVNANSVDSSVVGIHVGSENLYRKDVTPEQAISFVTNVKSYLTKQKVTIPVSVADIIDTLVQYPTVLEAVDVIQANEFPFWEPANIDTAMINFKTKMDMLTKVAKGKEIQISETGWASGGINANASATSPENHAKYLLNFYNYATDHNLKYYYFAAFDDAWKAQEPGKSKDVEAFFGLYDSAGSLKPLIANLAHTNSSIDPDNTNITIVPLTKTPVPPGAGSNKAAASPASVASVALALAATAAAILA